LKVKVPVYFIKYSSNLKKFLTGLANRLKVFDCGVLEYRDKHGNKRGRIETRHAGGRNENEDDFFQEYTHNI
jgi:hypothetical protein